MEPATLLSGWLAIPLAKRMWLADLQCRPIVSLRPLLHTHSPVVRRQEQRSGRSARDSHDNTLARRDLLPQTGDFSRMPNSRG
jgi:hypothetical protein